MAFSFEKLVCQGVLLVGEHRSMYFPSFCAKKDPSIEVGTFIVLEKPSSISEVVARTFITLDGPPEASEGITVLIEGHTPTEAVSGISYQMGIPPKPPNRVMVSIILACGDHF